MMHSIVVATLLLVAPVIAQESPATIEVKADWVDTKGAPMQLASEGFLKSTQDHLKQVHLRNATTDRTVAGFQLGWVTWVPEGCGVQKTEPSIHLAPYEAIVIAPGGTITSGPYRVATRTSLDLAMAAGSKRVTTQMGVVRVLFADGGEWKFDLEGKKAFDPGNNDASACQPAKSSTDNDDPALCAKSSRAPQLFTAIDQRSRDSANSVSVPPVSLVADSSAPLKPIFRCSDLGCQQVCICYGKTCFCSTSCQTQLGFNCTFASGQCQTSPC